MKQISTLTNADAQRAVDACLAAARELDARVTVAVVDVAGSLLMLTRMDGARGFSVDLATRKARTAAAIGIDTAILQKHAGSTPLSAEILAVPGGMPLIVAAAAAGAIGVSGAQPDQDGRIAEAGIKAINDSRQGS